MSPPGIDRRPQNCNLWHIWSTFQVLISTTPAGSSPCAFSRKKNSFLAFLPTENVKMWKIIFFTFSHFFHKHLIRGPRKKKGLWKVWKCENVKYTVFHIFTFFTNTPTEAISVATFRIFMEKNMKMWKIRFFTFSHFSQTLYQGSRTCEKWRDTSFLTRLRSVVHFWNVFENCNT